MDMKVYINRNPVRGPWGGGNLFVKAYHDIAPGPNLELLRDQTMNINPDVILLAGLEAQGPQEIGVEQAIAYKMYVKPDCQLVLRVNENDARKGTSHMDDLLLKIAPHVDATVFVSNWLRDYFLEKGWACQNNTVIYNGVDREVFKAQPKLNNGKLNIVAHHWSDNRLKGADIYEKLDELVGQHPDKFTFTYIGRHQCDFKHTKVIKPLHGKALGEELGKYDVYVSASRFDPGPNHITESISCELPTYVHVDGGGAVEFAGSDHVYRDWEELQKILVDGCFEPNSTKFSTWTDCVDRYNKFFEQLKQ